MHIIAYSEIVASVLFEVNPWF